MSNKLQTKYIYDFKFSDADEVKKYLLDLISLENSQRRNDIHGDIKDIANKINDILNKSEESLLAYNLDILKFVDVNLINLYIKDKTVVSLSNSLYYQLSIVYLTLSGISGDDSCYDLSSLKEILNNNSGYDNLLMLNTVYRNSFIKFDEGVVNLVFDIISDNNKNLYDKTFAWEGIFFSYYYLQFFWKMLPVLNNKNQQILFKNYFYFSSCVSVPVVNILEAFSSIDVFKEDGTRVGDLRLYLKNNIEKVPLNTEYIDWKDYYSVVNDYTVGLQENSNENFVREGIVNKLYSLQKGKDRLSILLRKSLTVVSFINNL